MLISPEYAEHNRSLHEAVPAYGAKGSQWAGYVAALVHDDGHASVLDYGCGKGSLAAGLALDGIIAHEYDPAVRGKDQPPAPADLVVCTDVLEHIEPDHLDDVLAHLASLTQRKLFVDVCTRPAAKTLPDGRNAHLSLHDAAWWKAKLSGWFDVQCWTNRPEAHFVYGELTPKGVSTRAPGARRRKMSSELSAWFDMVRNASAQHSDAMSRIESISMFERDGNRPSDMQVIFDILDDSYAPEKMLADAISFARKAIFLRAKLTPERSEDWWRALIETRAQVGSWDTQGTTLSVMAAPRVFVQNVKVVGARSSDERWEQVVANCSRVRKRIVPVAPHERTAILACYGPSLSETFGLLEAQAQKPAVDIVSVSGAHDFLLDRGIVPRFHVECDPRAHKADNIATPSAQVQYLIGSGVHPNLMDKLDGHDVALWHIATPEHVARFLNELKEPGNIVISGGGSVGLRAVSLLYTLGYRRFGIHGMDCAFSAAGNKWAGRHFGKAEDTVSAVVDGHSFTTSLTLLTYATDFIELIQRVDIDCELYGYGLLQTMVALHAAAAAEKRAAA